MNESVPALERPDVAEVEAEIRRFEAAAAQRRAAEIDCARALARLARVNGWSSMGCASVGEFGERFGIAADEARRLLRLGSAMLAVPAVETEVRDGKMSVVAAACIADVLADPTLQREGDDWLLWARTESTRTLRRRVEQRREDTRLGNPVSTALTVYVSTAVVDDFARAREIASRKARRVLTCGETFETIVDHYLASFDPDRVAPSRRRTPHTSGVAGRHVPMEVRRELYRRQAGRCAVPFCDHAMFLDMAHVVPHAKNGSREADNLVLLCGVHHRMFDDGCLRLLGTPDRPRFLDAAGHDLGTRFGSSPTSRRPPGAGPSERNGEHRGESGPAPPNV